MDFMAIQAIQGRPKLLFESNAFLGPALRPSIKA